MAQTLWDRLPGRLKQFLGATTVAFALWRAYAVVAAAVSLMVTGGLIATAGEWWGIAPLTAKVFMAGGFFLLLAFGILRSGIAIAGWWRSRKRPLPDPPPALRMKVAHVYVDDLNFPNTIWYISLAITNCTDDPMSVTFHERITVEQRPPFHHPPLGAASGVTFFSRRPSHMNRRRDPFADKVLRLEPREKRVVNRASESLLPLTPQSRGTISLTVRDTASGARAHLFYPLSKKGDSVG